MNVKYENIKVIVNEVIDSLTHNSCLNLSYSSFKVVIRFDRNKAISKKDKHSLLSVCLYIDISHVVRYQGSSLSWNI